MENPLPNRSKPTPEPVIIDVTPHNDRRRPSRLALLAGVCGLLLIALAVEIFMVPDPYLEAWHRGEEDFASYAPEIKVLDEGDQRFLWGGESETMRFDVTDCILESLWWPPTGEAVAGPLLGVPLNLLEKDYWKQTTWARIQSQHPEAVVLDKGQDFERPKSWPRYPVPEDLDALRQAKAEIAPKWGENQ